MNHPVVPADASGGAGIVNVAVVTGGAKRIGRSICLALARGMQATAVTADRAWADLDLAAIGVRVQLIR